MLDNKTGQDHSYGSSPRPPQVWTAWFLQNKEEKDVRLRLTVTNFFDSAEMYAGGPPKDNCLPEKAIPGTLAYYLPNR